MADDRPVLDQVNLVVRDMNASVEFYRQVFQWDTHVAEDTPELRYTTLGEGESQLAGIMDGSAFLPEGVPAYWSIYFAVEDADAALEEARRRKLVCFGLAGYGGGPMVTRGLLDHSITIDFEYIPRIQEAQASQYHILRRLVEMV